MEVGVWLHASRCLLFQFKYHYFLWNTSDESVSKFHWKLFWAKTKKSWGEKKDKFINCPCFFPLLSFENLVISTQAVEGGHLCIREYKFQMGTLIFLFLILEITQWVWELASFDPDQSMRSSKLTGLWCGHTCEVLPSTRHGELYSTGGGKKTEIPQI